MTTAIPFNKPYVNDAGRRYIAEALSSTSHSGDGPFTRKCHALLQSLLGVPKVLLTTSCTHALEMTALLLRLQPGDEVIVPSFTFTSTANAFALRGARIVFADIRPDTLNLDERQVERLITNRTKAIIVVHYAGVGCEMDVLLEVAKRHGVAVIEDNAHGLFGKYRGRYLGTFGDLAAQSFHETKNFSCGEGGALVINEPKLIEDAEVIREKGTNRSRFSAGRLTNIHGSVSAQAICRRIFSRHFCSRNWRRETKFSYDDNRFGRSITLGFGSGLSNKESGYPLPRLTVTKPITCSTCYCLRWRTDRL